MSRPAVVASALLAIAVVAMSFGLAVWVFGVDDPFTPDIVLFPVAYLTFAAIGALIVARRPEHPVGRLALLAGVGGAIVGSLDSWVRVTPPLPGREVAALLAATGFPVTLGPILFLVLLFPTGRLASPRWRIVGGAIALGILVLAAGNLLSPVFADYPDVRNPLAIEALRDSAIDQGGAGWLLVLFGAVGAALGLIPRLRRADGIERAQLKWITYAAALHGLSWIVLALDPPDAAGDLAQYVVFATLTLIPLAAGVAILRYRLYDIDVVIRRTLVYGAVIGVLAATYAVLIVGLQAVLSGLTGGSTLPVALSTLVVAALFAPLRTRIRDAVDRRFYRTRYSADRASSALGRRLREQIQLDDVKLELIEAAATTVRPATAHVWLRSYRRR